MWPLARRLRREGYDARLWGYPGSRKPVEDHAATLAAYVQTIPGNGPIHFVGFSLGAIVTRFLLASSPLARAGRFVMIGPPNHGCGKAEYLYRYRWFRWFYGDQSILQLFPSHKAFYKTVGTPPVEFGIIAGGKNDERGFLSGFGEDNDGTITVASARLEGARDFIVLPHWHTPLVWARDTQDQVTAFLKDGYFL